MDSMVYIIRSVSISKQNTAAQVSKLDSEIATCDNCHSVTVPLIVIMSIHWIHGILLSHVQQK